MPWAHETCMCSAWQQWPAAQEWQQVMAVCGASQVLTVDCCVWRFRLMVLVQLFPLQVLLVLGWHCIVTGVHQQWLRACKHVCLAHECSCPQWQLMAGGGAAIPAGCFTALHSRYLESGLKRPIACCHSTASCVSTCAPGYGPVLVCCYA